METPTLNTRPGKQPSVEVLANVDEAVNSLYGYCESQNWAGYDPYDALNSDVFGWTPFSRSRACRIVFTQLLKRSPINLRGLLRVRKEQNPKGLALFATAVLKMPGKTTVAKGLLDALLNAQSPERPYACWGYNFAWQNRVTLVPRWEPNIICTTFAGNALLDGYERLRNEEYLNAAVSATQFILHGLNITRTGDEICFSYTPGDHEQVHNANLLGAAFLARVHEHTRNPELLQYATASARFSVNRQAPDGSWVYSQSPLQQWVDNFHTGYNLLALKRLSEVTQADQFQRSLTKGFEFYRRSFFREDGVVKYYHNQTYPIDIHAVAHSILTLSEFRRLRADNVDLALKVFRWTWDHMRDRAGYYYFQKGPFVMNRNAYMRWSQGWMLLALAELAVAVRDKHGATLQGE